MIRLTAAGAIGKYFPQTILRLPLPAAHLVRMDFVLGRDRLHRAVTAQRIHRYPCFELRCESTSCRRHLVGPPHGLEYTLTSCPVFQDHLKILAEAGYLDGFKTKLEYPSENSAWHNTDYAQLAVAYWAEIGVDVELDLNERAVVVPRINAHTYEGMTYGMRSNNWNPPVFIRVVGYSDHMWNAAGVQDPVYDAMVDAVDSAASREEQMELTRKADDYFIAQQWVTSGPLTPSFSFWQPWIVGFNGEFSLGGGITMPTSPASGSTQTSGRR